MVINVQIQGLKKLQKKLKATEDIMRSMKPYWQLVGQYVQRKTIKERFDKEQAPDGQKWKPHSEMTKAMRLRRNQSCNMKILQDNGELRRSIQYEAGNNYVKVGSVLKYAKVHQFGAHIHVSKKQRTYLHYKGFHIKKSTISIPARPFLGLNDSERQYIKSMLRTFIKRHITGGG